MPRFVGVRSTIGSAQGERTVGRDLIGDVQQHEERTPVELRDEVVDDVEHRADRAHEPPPVLLDHRDLRGLLEAAGGEARNPEDGFATARHRNGLVGVGREAAAVERPLAGIGRARRLQRDLGGVAVTCEVVDIESMVKRATSNCPSCALSRSAPTSSSAAR